ncbi:MAG: 6-bladed beta-propeller [bacterium]
MKTAESVTRKYLRVMVRQCSRPHLRLLRLAYSNIRPLEHWFVIYSLAALLSHTGCISKPESLFMKLERIEKVRHIRLVENQNYPLGRIFDASISPDSVLHVLDIGAADIKLFNLDGTFIKKLGGRGQGPNELQVPRTMEVTKDYIVVADIGSKLTKWFDREGKLLRQISIDRLRPIMGNTRVVSENKLLHAALWDGSRNRKSAVHLIDSTGRILRSLGEFPEEYDNYELQGNRQIDFNHRKNTYVITFHQSPAMVIGNLTTGSGKMHAFEHERSKYISLNHPKGRFLTPELMEKLVLEEAYSDRVSFLTDSIVVRSYMRCSEESLKKRSMVLHKHFLQAYSTFGEVLGEVPLPGRLHAKYGDLLLVEEGDEPDNHIFGLYKAHFRRIAMSERYQNER